MSSNPQFKFRVQLIRHPAWFSDPPARFCHATTTWTSVLRLELVLSFFLLLLELQELCEQLVTERQMDGVLLSAPSPAPISALTP